MREISSLLENQIGTIKGIGPKKAAYFQKMEIYTWKDVLYAFPRDYEDRTNQKSIAALEEGETAFVRAVVIGQKKGPYRRGGKQTLHLLARDETGGMQVLFFHASYVSRQIKRGDRLWFFGKVSFAGQTPQMLHPQWGRLSDEKDPQSQGILPVYPLTQGLSQTDRRRAAAAVLQEAEKAGALEEYLPLKTRRLHQLCGIDYALQNIHFPMERRQMLVAKYRLIFEEFMILSAGLQLAKARFSLSGKGIVFDPGLSIRPFIEAMPYSLTTAQKRTFEQILSDMESEKVMRRLVQGDVGSGKTVVAAGAVYKAVMCGYQAVLMAPTEILARQHVQTFSQLFEGVRTEKGKGEPFRIGFLSSSLAPGQRRLVLEELAKGRIHVLIGTHALIQPSVVFHRLGLVITDEQHRFGVMQRELLNQKGENCDTLVMTATPIPRTLALTLYADMDVSLIDEKPAGRQPVRTAAFEEDKRALAYRILYQQLKEGRQGYVVAPLIESSQEMDLKSAEEIYLEMKEHFAEFSVALLHGRMKQEEKDQVMEAFQKGRIQLLVSTVVIEVGINVPNATVMIIEHADRFGLSQMHQLRGRVGRGSHGAYCMLIGSFQSEVARKRARAMAETDDGFRIAEMDLTLRGPGEFFGLRQHGLPELRIADLVRHKKILKAASEETKRLMKEDPFLEKPENRRLKREIHRRFQSGESAG